MAPRRLRLPAGRHRLRVRLQQPRPGHRGGRRPRSSRSRPARAGRACWWPRRPSAPAPAAAASTTSPVAARRRGGRRVPRPRRARAAESGRRPSMQGPDPTRPELDPIERASRRRAARARSSSGCAGRCGTRTRTCPPYRAMFERAGVHPADVRELGDLARVPVHRQGGPAGQLPVRHVRRARASRSPGCTPPAAPPAGPPSSATPPTTCAPGPG